MKDRPILFSAPMVRAILAGTKTQTRRKVYNRRTTDYQSIEVRDDGTLWPWRETEDAQDFWYKCPYGQPGDRLWVRETGWERPERTPKMMREGADTWPKFAYDADGWNAQDHADFKAWGFKRRPSIHMPHWASRITLEITDIRVERLNDINDEDAIAEGLRSFPHKGDFAYAWRDDDKHGHGSPTGAYRNLWEQINGAGSWSADPWVWVVEYKRVAA